MKTMPIKLIAVSIGAIVAGHSSLAAADDVTDALTSGKAYGDIRLRYESVDQDLPSTNPADDATALTVRTRLGYVTGSVSGFSATLEMEDSRIVAGQDEYTVGPTGFNPGEYSVIGDPETTEVDQAFIQYKTDSLTAKLGRQVLTYDGHRFVGHVGWRQDRQTFDGISFKYTPVENLTLHYAYLDERNRIFAEEADFDSKDHLFNAAYKTGFGTLTGYAYLLEIDEGVDNALDTFGVSFKGAAPIGDMKLLYAAEYATQEKEAENVEDKDADYMLLEGGLAISGITAKLGYEVLGSDDSSYGFSTPLATLHKFNGWSDQFLATPGVGLVDTYVSASGKIAGGTLTVVYHDFEADEDTAAIDDLGSEIDVAYAKKFGKNYNAGIKYAAYSAGDDDAKKYDTDKLWVWVGASF